MKTKSVPSIPSPLMAMPVLSLILKTLTFSLLLTPHPTKQSTASATLTSWKTGSSIHDGEHIVDVKKKKIKIGWVGLPGNSLQQNNNLTGENYENKYKIIYSICKLS